MSIVRPEFGPTLPALLAPRWRRLSRTARAVIAVVVVVLAALVIRAVVAGEGADNAVVIRGPIEMNFIYRAPLERLAPGPGELAAVGGDGQRLAVRELRLPPFTGDVSGILPLYAAQQSIAMAKQYDGFLVRQEGRVNINKIQGYELVFQFRRDGRLTYGRRVMLPTTVTSRQGADVLLTAPRVEGTMPTALTLGRSGPLKVPLRSMRFGTERP